MARFVTCTSARCFVGVELPDHIFDLLMAFNTKLNHVVKLTYFIPKFLLTFQLVKKNSFFLFSGMLVFPIKGFPQILNFNMF